MMMMWDLAGVAALDVAAEKQEQHEDRQQTSRAQARYVSSLGIMLGPTGTDGL